MRAKQKGQTQIWREGERVARRERRADIVWATEGKTSEKTYVAFCVAPGRR